MDEQVNRAVRALVVAVRRVARCTEPLEQRTLLAIAWPTEPAMGPLPNWQTTSVQLAAAASVPGGLDPQLIAGVPAYLWRHGCGPTATGMIMGYWDGHGFDNLVNGDASLQTAAVNEMIASTEHYNDYAVPLDDLTPGILPDKSDLGGAHANNSIADWMQTSWSLVGNKYGWSWFSDVPGAIEGYADYRGYSGAFDVNNVVWGSSLWSDFKAEIDANRPAGLIVDTNADGYTDHFIAAIGYDDFNHKYACYDTWNTSIRWYSFTEMTAGQEFGVYGATFVRPVDAPSDITLSNDQIVDDQPAGTAVGTFTTVSSATDPVFTYSLVSGAGSADNASFWIVGDELQTAAVFAGAHAYQIRVRSTDQNGLFFEKAFTINITSSAPTVTADVPSVTWRNLGQKGYDLVVHYDGSFALDASSVDGDEIAITGPDGLLPVALVSTTVAPDGMSIDATYHVTPPGGTWSSDDNGNYTIAALPGTLWDTVGHQNRAVELDSLHVTVPGATAMILTVPGTPNADTISVTLSGSSYVVNRNGIGFSYAGSSVRSIVVSGLAGNDRITITGAIYICQVSAGAGNDTIEGGSGDDLIRGDEDNDVITGNGGEDTLYGNFGNDTISGGDGADSIMAGLGYDSLLGGSGNDSLYAGDQMDSVYGDEGDDYIEGRGKADTIYGGAGNDTILGGAGSRSDPWR